MGGAVPQHLTPAGRSNPARGREGGRKGGREGRRKERREGGREGGEVETFLTGFGT